MGRKNIRKEQTKSFKQTQFKDKGLTTSSQNTRQKYDDTYGYKDVNLTDSQKDCLDVIKNNTIIFIEGPAGVGKSMLVFYYAVQQYLKDVNMGIKIIRTPVEAGGDKIGFLPSDLNSKLEPHFVSAKRLLEMLLTPSKVQSDMEGPYSRIHFEIPNFQIGDTWDNMIVCLDESQQVQPLIMKLLLERIGVNSKIIIMGDPTQIYSGHGDRQGMRHAMNVFFDIDKNTNQVLEARYEDIGYYKFEAEDCQRSDAAKTVVKAYAEHGQGKEVFKY